MCPCARFLEAAVRSCCPRLSHVPVLRPARDGAANGVNSGVRGACDAPAGTWVGMPQVPTPIKLKSDCPRPDCHWLVQQAFPLVAVPLVDGSTAGSLMPSAPTVLWWSGPRRPS